MGNQGSRGIAWNSAWTIFHRKFEWFIFCRKFDDKDLSTSRQTITKMPWLQDSAWSSLVCPPRFLLHGTESIWGGYEYCWSGSWSRCCELGTSKTPPTESCDKIATDGTVDEEAMLLARLKDLKLAEEVIEKQCRVQNLKKLVTKAVQRLAHNSAQPTEDLSKLASVPSLPPAPAALA